MYVHFPAGGPKPHFYAELARALDALLTDETDRIANLSNAAALLWHSLPNINWAGFYLSDGGGEGGLVLGPFQGKPACTRIGPGCGVCGAAAARRQTVVVPDVHDFPGHIACDQASRSEIVVPLLATPRPGECGGDNAPEVYGVLDVDSPDVGRFDSDDAEGLALFAAVLRRHLGLGSSA
jgi:L-methionine (R)-S-oxide reductase